jgi:hypothetical protein
MSRSGAILLRVDGIHNLLAEAFAVFGLKSRCSVVAVSRDFVANGLGRFGLEDVGDGIEGSGPSCVMSQGSVSLVVREVISGLVLSRKVRGGTKNNVSVRERRDGIMLTHVSAAPLTSCPNFAEVGLVPSGWILFSTKRNWSDGQFENLETDHSRCSVVDCLIMMGSVLFERIR